MSGRRWVGRAAAVWTLAALVVVLITSGVAAGSASAAGSAPSPSASPVPGGPSAVGEVPAAVRAAFEGEELRRGARTPETNAVRELTAGPVHQVFHFTDAFMQGEPGADPVEATQEWVAGVQGDGAPLGWLRVAGGGGSAAPVMWQPDPPGGAAFLASSASALVEVPWDYAYFTLVDGVVTPVKVQSWDAGLGPRDLAQVQADFAVSRAETAAAYACCSPSDGCGGGSAPVGGAAPGGSRGGDGQASCGSGLPSPGALAFAAVAVLLAVGVGVGWTVVRQLRTRTGGAGTSRWVPGAAPQEGHSAGPGHQHGGDPR